MKDLNSLAERIVSAINETKNDYDAKDIVLELLTKEEELYNKQFKPYEQV